MPAATQRRCRSSTHPSFSTCRGLRVALQSAIAGGRAIEQTRASSSCRV
ncbi:hypothetical protein J4732_11540 [Serratia marcescens]|uniref:Uncharacterized protein n=1 Tax=Serratia marcescens TaxID=615 RepID=A0A939NLZ3_SERMA|nr:hypothetical protein [Serratia marcescens]